MLSSIIDTALFVTIAFAGTLHKYGCIRNIHYNLFIKTYFYYI